MSKNIAAFTSAIQPQPNYVVPFVSINKHGDGSVTISVRSGGPNLPTAAVTLSDAEWANLKQQLADHDN